MKHLSVDIETFSAVDIKNAGLYKYAESFELLLFAYAVDFGAPEVVDLTRGEAIPEFITKALNDPKVLKHAYNATFEWYCLNKAGYKTELSQWHCTMVHGLYCGYPAGLSRIGAAMKLPEEKLKMSIGKSLIRYFCTPCKPTAKNGKRARNLPEHDPEKWELFKAYNAQDVITEIEVLRRLTNYPLPEKEHRLWVKDTLLNARGILVDRRMIEGALTIDSQLKTELTKRFTALTGLDNPNGVAQMKKWVEDRLGEPVDNLQKATVDQLIAESDNKALSEVLSIRQRLGKTSTSKYAKMLDTLCADERVRGLLQFYGASRTGRWAGRLVQVQNLPRNYLKTLDTARQIVSDGNLEGLRLIYGDVADTLSQLIRTAFIAPEDKKFIVSDFSAIEARVIAWLAGEQWVMDVFATHGKIYEATASQMFGVPIEKIVKGEPEYKLRQKGKVATLALGYQGAAGALIAMGALNMGLTEDELPDVVSRWRSANQNIVALWHHVENTAINVVATGKPQFIKNLSFRLESDILYNQQFLTIELPSGRKLYYLNPALKEGKFNKAAIYYTTTGISGKAEETATYGGKLTENIVQAIARDCLAEAMLRLQDVVMHIHDEVVIEADKTVTVEEINKILSQPIPWAPGLLLTAAGFESSYYMKD